MNQRLVESVAQIVLSMSEEERHLLDRNLQECGLYQWAESDPMQASERSSESESIDKSSRVAELAQDIQAFEERYHPSLSALPGELPGALTVAQWTASGMPADAMSPPMLLTSESSSSDDSSACLQSFFQLTQPFHSDTADDDTALDYAVNAIAAELLSDAPGQNRRF